MSSESSVTPDRVSAADIAAELPPDELLLGTVDAESAVDPEAPAHPPVDVDAVIRSAGRGMIWQVFGAGWQTAVQLGGSVVLARILFPRDYGILGMAMLAQGFIGRAGTLGTTAGLIAKEHVDQDDLSTAFWTCMAVQTLMFAAAYAGAPLAAMFFRTPELTAVLQAISFTFLLTGIGAVSGALLRKRLQFGLLKIIESAGFTIQTAVALVLAAACGMGYWSLVFAIIICAINTTAAAIVYARWMPSLRFSRASFRFQFRFGLNEFGSSMVGYFRHNTGPLLVGRLLGPVGSGLLEFSYRIPNMVLDRVALPLNTVLFPSLAKVQADDERLATGCAKATGYLALIVLPAMAGLAAVADAAVHVLWGYKWVMVIPSLRILCLSPVIACVACPVGPVFLCKGRPDILFKFELANVLFAIAAISGLGWLFGLEGVALGMVLSSAPSLVLVVLAFRWMRTPMARLFVELLPPVLASALCGAAAFAASQALGVAGLPWTVRLAVAVPTGVVVYVGTLVLLFPSVLAQLWTMCAIVLGRRRKAEGIA